MKRKNVIVMLGIIAMISLASRFADASYLAYTREGDPPACENMLDFMDMSLFIHQGDGEAAMRLVNQGRCILLKPGIQVYAWNPLYGTHPDWVQIHAVGSTKTLWTFKVALEERTQEEKIENPPPRQKNSMVLLTSLSWIKVHKTTRGEIIKKYPNPAHRDETGGEYAYKGFQYPDFREWERISFIFDGAVLEEIRVEKRKE